MNPLIGTDVEVYWNLHRNVWSIRDRRTRRVVAHSASVELADVSFAVSAAGNARVREEGRKNVHAFGRGRLVSLRPTSPPAVRTTVTYNPYEHTTFVTKPYGQPVFSAERAWFGYRTVAAIGLDTEAQAA